jgi:hypothetical protein
MSRVGSLVPVDVLNALVPSAEFAEFHSRTVAAPPNLVDRAIRSVTLREMPLVKMLFALRSLPDRLTGRPGLPTSDKLPLLDQMLGAGFMLLAGRSKSRNSHRNSRSGEGTPESRRSNAKGDEFAGFRSTRVCGDRHKLPPNRSWFINPA